MTDAIQPISSMQHADVGAQRIRPDVESFLTLLTAQISNQDPLEPMDSSTFVTQLAQLSQVEQSMEMGMRLETISSQLADAATVANLGLIGRAVEVPGNTVRPGGDSGFFYELGEAATRVTASIVGDDGTVLRRFDGLSGAAGSRHELRWDGRDDAGLPVLGEGPFNIALTAEDEAGSSVEATTWVEATVADVVNANGTSMLSLDNGTTVAPSSIARIR